MYYYKALLVLLWCTTCGQARCTNASICVASENEREVECQHTIRRLSDLTPNETSCNTVHIFLTSGTHALRKSITFSDSVEDTAIHGAAHDKPAIIECWNKTGIRFSENVRSNKVFISNIVLSHCHTTVTTSWDLTSQAALYFHNALYTISNVAVMYTVGYGLYANQCREHVVINCTFSNNSRGHIQVVKNAANTHISVLINRTTFRDGGGGGVNITLANGVYSTITIKNCEFQRNKMAHLLVISAETTYLTIEKSVFTTSKDVGAHIVSRYKLTAFIQNCTFVSNTEKGLLMEEIYAADIGDSVFANNGDGIRVNVFTMTSTRLWISSCVIQNNTGTGIAFTLSTEEKTAISKTLFSNNSIALSLRFISATGTATIRTCKFVANRINQASAVVKIEKARNTEFVVTVIVERCSFERNHGIHGDCSALLVVNNYHVTLNNVTIADNNCTGITLLDSKIKLKNTINLTRNRGLRGGALALKGADKSNLLVSKFTFTQSSKLNIINNTADMYGGGIYSEETCGQYTDYCFFLFEANYRGTDQVLAFSGNSAEQGGDIVFGGCLSDCWVAIKGKILINKNDPYNTFWNLSSSKNVQSLSEFVEDPKRAVFCRSTFTNGVMCDDDSYTVSAYRGQIFTVPLMVTDGFCTPSVELIEAKVYYEESETLLELEQDIIQKARKYCYHFSYALKGGVEMKIATLAFTIQKQLLSNIPPVTLTVHLKDCPTGYEIDLETGKCNCQDVLRLYKIECNSSTYSLKIPAQIWVGNLREGSGSIGVQRDCQYCNKEGTLTITNITRDSDELCITNRTGILCGACAEGYSLQLGGYECADCSNSTHIGVLLLVAFTVIGIALVLLLLGLNLTVSTGMINGLIFYSNIVYLNSDALLPITREGNSTHQQNTVKLLSTFQAWMNLDFGITTCFFEGYDTYISTWMQFVFPLYIWLLILVIVLASRYSSRISKITTSNTVSVLATLLLLAYAKLLKTSIESFSSVQVQLLDGKFSHTLWKSDANISYLGPIHLPLFLMSLVMLLAYILPFTLLILLGPLLQAKSHYRVLNWINKLKPFLDAFYGPYTSRYRYWPGILLLARLVILITWTLHDSLFKLTTVSVMVSLLLAIWMVIGKTNAVSLHQKICSNYLELFFLLNLSVFVATSIYISQLPHNNVARQQGLAVAMVGSALVVFCGILARQIFCTLSKCKLVRNSVRYVGLRIKRDTGNDTSQDPAQETDSVSTKTTHSLVEMKEGAAQYRVLRERLLTNSYVCPSQ